MRVYKNIKVMESKSEAKNNFVMNQKRLRSFSVIFICLLTFAISGIGLSSLNLSREIKSITASWSPNIADLGKLKFVNNDEVGYTQTLASIDEMRMPFENNFVEEVSSGVFLVNGLGGVVVKSCLDGKVSKVDENDGTKTVTLLHGKSLVSVYELLDNVGVKVGDKIEKNTPLGVSYSSVIRLKLLYKNKVLAGLEVKDGVLTFM